MTKLIVQRLFFHRLEDDKTQGDSIDAQLIGYLNDIHERGGTLVSQQQVYERNVSPGDRTTYVTMREYLVTWLVSDTLFTLIEKGAIYK